MTQSQTSQRRTALVTGAAGGIGRAIARGLLGAGYVVHAADVVGLEALPTVRNLRKHLCDVTDDGSVAALASAVGAVDVLVNNAGIAVFNTAEEANLSTIRHMFDVNVLGAARITQAFLPSLRARSGTVVQISSIAKLVVFEESGFYAATKHALEAMTDALRRETAHTGIRIRVVRPGNYATGLQEAAAARSPTKSPSSPYASRRAQWEARLFTHLERDGQDPTEVAEAVIATLADPDRYAVVHVGRDADKIAAEGG